MTTPSAPIDLVEVTEHRTKSTLGIAWSPATFTGGSQIEDFRVSIAVVGEVFQTLATGLTSPEFVATGLTAGVSY